MLVCVSQELNLMTLESDLLGSMQNQLEFGFEFELEPAKKGCNFMNFSKNIRGLKCKTEEMMLKLRKEIEIAHEDEVHMYCNDNRDRWIPFMNIATIRKTLINFCMLFMVCFNCFIALM
ncbi:hypothetical protein L1987_47826 [Smallanthus sonchifolius]|uniref:Uncharacterized protein n=1 Tax=Smallanthus sonchifolius TaxID=185202 RepID=A0ACB9FQR1_9ASTR|nr:hypothetical protein L1987_47826 [Smallanthus sonchifolius]